MGTIRKMAATCVLAIAACLSISGGSFAQPATTSAADVLETWYRLTLELVRHTPTYSPPVASRSLAYLGVTAFEVVASGDGELQSLGGQLNEFEQPVQREPGAAYDEAVALESAMSHAIRPLFANTGPTGQRAMAAVGKKLSSEVSRGLSQEVVARSEAYGRTVAEHVLAWSAGDGGAVVENMGFPLAYVLKEGPAHWVPTSLVSQQQTPLLPDWGRNRPLVMPDGASCPLPPPPEYSEEKDSRFYEEALEVYETVNGLSEEQQAIARFWSDDPMLSPTPPGHWMSIATQILDREDAGLARRVEVLARLGLALSDSFIACWHAKYEFDLVRPVTYIRRVIDPRWVPILNTPPFPEYPSGHSTQSAAAAEVLADLFGDPFEFVDATHESDGLPARRYRSFRHAADEAGISRLYGGIHFRAAIERGLEQGRCVAAFVNGLRTRETKG